MNWDRIAMTAAALSNIVTRTAGVQGRRVPDTDCGSVALRLQKVGTPIPRDRRGPSEGD